MDRYDIPKTISKILKYPESVNEIDTNDLRLIKELLEEKIPEMNNKALELYYQNNGSITKEECRSEKLKNYEKVLPIIKRQIITNNLELKVKIYNELFTEIYSKSRDKKYLLENEITKYTELLSRNKKLYHKVIGENFGLPQTGLITDLDGNSYKDYENIELWFRHLEYLKALKQNETLPPQQNIETLSNLITHAKSAEIVNGVKIQYKNIKGKKLSLLLKAFQELQLLPKDRIASKFHTCCKYEFDWDIATYNAMKGAKFNEITDSEDLAEMKHYIESLIKVK